MDEKRDTMSRLAVIEFVFNWSFLILLMKSSVEQTHLVDSGRIDFKNETYTLSMK